MLATHGSRIGPNSLIQTVNALKERYGPARTGELLRLGGRADLLDHPPDEMVNEQEFIDLERLLIDQLGIEQAAAVLYRSGQLTAGYLLANRIPRPVQWLLRVLPARPGMRILFGAIGKHAWTFVGSGHFTFTVGRTTLLTIERCPACREVRAATPFCTFYGGAFETLLKTLIDRRIVVREIVCAACGGDRCVFEVTR